MKQITPLLHEWSRCDASSESDLNGHFVQAAAGEPGVLVDPVAFNEGDETHVRRLGGGCRGRLTAPAAPALAICGGAR